MSDTYDRVAPKFRSRRAFSNYWTKANEQIVNNGEYKELDDLILNYPATLSPKNDLVRLKNRLIRISLADFRYCTAKAIATGDLSKVDLLSALSRYCLSLQLTYYNFHRLRINTVGDDSRLPPVSGIGQLGIAVMFSAVFFHKDFFKSILNFSLSLFDVEDAVGNFEAPLMQVFSFRLLDKIYSPTPRDWKGGNEMWSVDPCKEEELFAELWSNWNTEDIKLIEDLLIKLANRHTFHASRDNKDGSRDFQGQAEQYPIDVFFIMRLREWAGLENPSIMHRITEPPFDRLPEVVEAIEFSDDLKILMKKIRKEIPDFDEVINKSKTRDWEMLL